MTEFQKNIARDKKLTDFLESRGFELSGCGFSDTCLVYKKGEMLQPGKWQVGEISNEYKRNIDLSVPLDEKDFPFIL